MKLALIFLLCAVSATADAAVDLNFFDDIQKTLEDKTSEWRDRLVPFATNLLFILTGISLTWQAILMVLRNAD